MDADVAAAVTVIPHPPMLEEAIRRALETDNA